VLIDPWTAEDDARLRPPPPTDELAAGVDWVLITHEHADHLDRRFLARVGERSPGARIALPAACVAELTGHVPSERCVAVAAGDVLELAADVRAEVVPAFHALAPEDPTSSDRFVGYVIHAEGMTLYHAGDTVITDALLADLRGRRVDIALLPINGRDAFRERAGIVGNLIAREAVRLATELGASVLIPMHWDMVSGNTERPGAVLDAVTELDAPLHVLTLSYLRPFRLT
jgi:L-ascorbate 6-phosphate lactonase